MKKKNLITLGLIGIMAFSLIGCKSTNTTPLDESVSSAQEVSLEDASETASTTSSTDSTLEAPYILKGVYEVEKDDDILYYVFSEDTYGYTEKKSDKTGLPFNVIQKNNEIRFTFGGEGEKEEVFTVTSIDERNVTGHFEDGKEFTFKFLEDAAPEFFDSFNYNNADIGINEAVYDDANGWSVKYDPTKFDVITENGVTLFTYTGESAGANVIMASYNVDMTVEEKVEELKKSYGETATSFDGIFPGTEDVTGYWVNAGSDEGSGLYQTAILREYMDGYLLFEITSHMSGDEEMDTEVSDNIANVIDSITFENFEE